MARRLKTRANTWEALRTEFSKTGPVAEASGALFAELISSSRVVVSEVLSQRYAPRNSQPGPRGKAAAGK